MIRRLRSKKGFVFPFACFVLLAMSIYVAVFVNKTFNDHLITKRNLLALKNRYRAFAGIEAVTYEMTAQQNWYTHTAVEQGSAYILTPKEIPPNVILSAHNRIIPAGEQNGGSYAALDGSFVIKSYISPASGKPILYAKGYDANGESILYVVKYNGYSFYDYFIFTPNELELSRITLDAAAGAIHSNQDVVLKDTVSLSNVGKLNTPEAIRYFIEAYVPERDAYIPGALPPTTWGEYYYWLSSPWFKPYHDPTEGDIYRNRNDGHLYGEKNGLLMEDPLHPGQYIEWIPSSGSRYIDPDVNPDPYRDSTLISYLNGKELPNRLGDESYSWNKYWRATEDWGTAPEEIDVNYTNSKLQPTDWADLMQTYGLQDTVKEANTGGQYVGAMTTDAEDLKTQAQSNGIYIERQAASPNYKVYINGTEYSSQGGEIKIGGDVVFENKIFINTNSTYANWAVIAYVDKLIEHDVCPSNGIIYSPEKIVLDNAEQLPSGGLTTISNNSLFIKGDYNTEDWQPSAAMSAGYVFFLSDQFNYPRIGKLPKTFHNLEYPYVADFIKGSFNWYALHDPGMANQVDKDYTYVVSVITPHNDAVQTLERWWYYKNPGDQMNPPSGVITNKRQVIGSLITLPEDNIELEGLLDINQKGNRSRFNPGWPEDMGSVVPRDANNAFSYDEHYLLSDTEKPPGTKNFFDPLLTIRLKNTDDNWNNYLSALY